ncbi:MAG TPA: phosphoenolpyruvate synthase [Acidiferrobacteraceae bacterium]|nr:phosphoenolpyruvate synthase [Acidiferrobacteraceae bacterium]
MATDLVWLDKLGLADIAQVGGKNASLGEMITKLSAKAVRVPGGFATTASAFRQFMSTNGLGDRIYPCLDQVDVEDVHALALAGTQIRKWILETPFSRELEQTIGKAYEELTARYGSDISLAVRSSATAEDLPTASFAGQQDSYLNISGVDNLLATIKAVYGSLFTDRAIAYRVHQGFTHRQVALSVGVQCMVRSDNATSGVMFTLDTESGFTDVVFITSAYGLGETVVQGLVNPDEFYVYKPTLKTGHHPILRRSLGTKAIRMTYGQDPQPGASTTTEEVSLADQQRYSISDDEVIELAQLALIIEEHYGCAMDIEWAKDSVDGQLYVVQARPETVKSRDPHTHIQRYELKTQGEVLTSGRSIGQRIGAGTARVLLDISEINHIAPGEVLVTDMTDPSWEPIMQRAAAIVTNRGGRTCHAAIIARELGIPAVVGCDQATEKIVDGQAITVSCSEGDEGKVYANIQEFTIREIKIDTLPLLPFKIMLNVGTPDRAFDFSFLPNDGVGLARVEFIINRAIGVHPKALLHYAQQPQDIQQQIDALMVGYSDPVQFYIEKLSEGMATIAAAFAPKPVILRTSDFKSNEYASLLGGKAYEPGEENPMLGFRGAARYLDDHFKECFELECAAIKRVRNDMGLTNLEIMTPFVRTVEEAQGVVALLEKNGLRRGDNGLRLIMMCEIPSNALLADQFLQYFDGFSIGSNDLTQLTLGLDRDSSLIADLFDERNAAVKSLLSMAISACRKANKYVGICGQGPSDYPDFAQWLMEQGIHSISLNPDSVIETWMYLAKHP